MSIIVSDQEFVSTDVINGRQTTKSYRRGRAGWRHSGRPAIASSMLDPSICGLSPFAAL
jgi:hypothetical protein